MARKKYLQGIANAVVKKMTGQVKSPGKLLDALGRAASERRISVWSAFPEEQKVLEETTLGHIVSDDAAPLAEVVINNFGGNKMDYYLTRDRVCRRRLRRRHEEFDNHRAVDQHDRRSKVLPEYVAGAMGLPPDLPFKVPPGTMVSSVRVIATKGAKLVGLTANGERTAAISKVERGHPTFEVQVVIPPGQSGELVFQLSEPTSQGRTSCSGPATNRQPNSRNIGGPLSLMGVTDRWPKRP